MAASKLPHVKLLLIRHAQSANNLLSLESGGREGRCPDPPLTTLGVRQAARLSEWTAAPGELGGALRSLTHLYSSLTTRAVQTGAPLAHALGLPLHGLAEAHEIGGLYSGHTGGNRAAVLGRTHADLQTEYPGLVWPAQLDAAMPWAGGFEGLDDHTTHTARAARVLETIRAERAEADRVGLITHQGFAQFLLAYLAGFEPTHRTRYRVNNTGTCLVDLDENTTVYWLNRHDHLSEDLLSH